jgi:hypothetical protein
MTGMAPTDAESAAGFRRGSRVRTWNAYIAGPCIVLLGVGILSPGVAWMFADPPLNDVAVRLLAAFMLLLGLSAVYAGLRMTVGGIRITGGRVEILNAWRTHRIPLEEIAEFRIATRGLYIGACELVKRDGSTIAVTSVTGGPAGDFGTAAIVDRLNAAIATGG